MQSLKILVTGGLGFIGSHLIVSLIKEGYQVIVIDNLSNSCIKVRDQILKLTGVHLNLYTGDIRDRDLLEKIFSDEKIDLVVHLAGFKNVGESVTQPLEYYDVNFGGTCTLLQVMEKSNCRRIIFSSSTTVYGDQQPPYHEDMEVNVKKITNPYGKSKAMIEEMLTDLYYKNPDWSIVILRYFNPIGSHPSGDLGEDPVKKSVNLFPMILKVATGEKDKLILFGDNYDTIDGTCVRDYIHVVDLVDVHMLCLSLPMGQLKIYNVGTGRGTTVKELINCFEKETGITVPFEIGPKRSGDLSATYASVELIKKELGWEANRNLGEACRDGWHYVQKTRYI